MASSSTPMSNLHITTSALDGHLNNLRSSVPPSIKSACFPDSASTFLRNILLSMGVINALLFLSSLFAVGVRFLGFTTFLVSIASCVHVSCLAMVFGDHLADAVSSSSMLGIVGARLGHVLRNSSRQRYGGSDNNAPYAHGAMVGSALMMALLMHVVSSYYGGVAECVANAAHKASSSSSSGSGHHDLTGGYANMHDDGTGSSNSNTSSSSSSYPYGNCGASGPVGFVSFLAGLLFWLNAVLAGTLHVKRDELLSGSGGGDGDSGGGYGGSSYSNQYDEIGIVDVDNDGDAGFAGDFPPASATGMTTMHV